MGTGPAPAAGDPCVVVGEVAALLAAGQGVPDALEALTRGLSLRSAVLRSTDGELLGVGGESVQAAGPVRAVAVTDGWLELTVRARGAHVAVLTVQGARPSQVAALRTAAAVLGLALLSTTSGEPNAGELLEDHEAEQVALADALHDGPMQSLMAARYAADAVARGGDPAEVRAAVQQAVVELRRQLWQVRPRGSSGLLDALTQLSDRLVEAGGPALALSGDGADLSGPAAVAAFRVVQEVATSAEGPLTVVLRQTRSGVVVELSGARPLEPRPRWARRTSAVGGHLTCASGRISVTLPVTAPLSTPFGQARTSS
jgi:signal transduction histidine kinase